MKERDNEGEILRKRRQEKERDKGEKNCEREKGMREEKR